MDIVIVSEFCEDFSKSDNDRFLYIAKMLCKEHDVEIVTSNFRHTTKKKRTKIATKWPFRITFLHEPGYSTNICLKRFQSHFVWGRNVGKYLKKRKVPDMVYCAVPSLTAANEACNYCRKHHVRFVIDIQDLWPEAFYMIFHVPIVSSVVFLPFRILANRVYRDAEDIVAVSETYAKRAVRVRNSQKATVVYLGTNLDDFDKNARENIVFHKKEGELWLGYCGTLGASYDISFAIDVLSEINKNGYKAPKFIVMGDGPDRNKLMKEVKKKKIDCVFTGRLPYNKMCSILKACDMVINPIKCRAAQSIINKHADYAASGKPVLNTQDSVEYSHLIEQYEMGYNCDTKEKLAKYIIILIEDKELREWMGVNARQCAEDKFDRNKIYKKIDYLVNSGRLREI